MSSENLLITRDSSKYGSTNIIDNGQFQTEKQEISFHNLVYEVSTKKGKLTVLNNVSGIFSTGMNAILGPTGSGKTSLLDLLARRKNYSGLSGEILLNGKPLPADFKLKSGYVVQDDVVMGTLTIRENLMFSANMRLSSSEYSTHDKEIIVKSVIEELGLTYCANTLVGDELVKGASGGERKRCNIAMELITSPSVLFLDEPTTGLDSNTAISVMKLLKEMSDKGRTIVFSIHQPRYSIFELFENIHLLSRGKTIYFGSQRLCVDYFQKLGIVLQENVNPADFFLDIILVNEYKEAGKANQLQIGVEASNLNLVETFKSSDICKENERKLDNIYSNKVEDSLLKVTRFSYPTNPFTQMYYLSKRIGLRAIRAPLFIVIDWLFNAFFATICGYLYFKDGKSHDLQSGFQNLYGSFFIIGVNCMFQAFSAADLWLSERALFLHERANGFYRASTYFLATVISQILMNRIIPTIIFATIAYFMIDYKHDTYAIYVLTLWSAHMAGLSVVYFISSLVPSLPVAQIFIPIIFVLMILYGGLFVNISSMPKFLQYFEYLSIPRYILKALSVSQLKDDFFCPTDELTKVVETCLKKKNNSLSQCVPSECLTGKYYLEINAIKYKTDWDFWQNIVAMWIIVFVLFLLCYLRLRTMKKLK